MLKLKPVEDPLCNMFKELGLKFEERLLTVATSFAEAKINCEDESASMSVMLSLANGEEIEMEYLTSQFYSTTVWISKQELQKWKSAYTKDLHFKLVVKTKEDDQDGNLTFPQYHQSEEGLMYLKTL